MRGGYIEVRGGRLHTNFERKSESGKGGGCARIGEWLGCLEDGQHVDWNPGDCAITRVR